MTVYPTLEQVLRDCSALGLTVRDAGLLDSALHRPSARYAGQDAYPTVPLKAAAMLHSLLRNHALVDGNKRIAWLVTVIFLDLNGWRSTLDATSAARFVLRVVAEPDLSLEEIAAGLALAPVDPP